MRLGYSEDAVLLVYEVVVIEDVYCGIGIPVGSDRSSMDEAREWQAQLGVGTVASGELSA